MFPPLDQAGAWPGDFDDFREPFCRKGVYFGVPYDCEPVGYGWFRQFMGTVV